jgi:hypothetical protein
MLNPVLQKKLPPECLLLYKMKMKINTPEFKTLVHDLIKKARVKSSGTNKEEYKLQLYKNDGGWYREKAKELVKELYKIKAVPATDIGLWRSIEFECVFKSKEAETDFAYSIRALGLAKYIVIKTDGSLRRNNDDPSGIPREITLTYRKGNEKAVEDFCRTLQGRAYVNQSCGTHVHFDMRHLSASEATMYGERLARCVPALKVMLPYARRSSQYCCNNTINSTAHDPNNGQKYAFVNLAAYSKYKTIEIRGHSGTINAAKILNWIKVCEVIMSVDMKMTPTEKTSAPVNTIEELLSQYKFDDSLAAYINEREKVFKDALISEKEEKTDPVIAVAPPSALIPMVPRPRIVRAKVKKASNG